MGDYEKLRGAVNQAMIRRFLNGGTRKNELLTSLSEYIGQGSERHELKHLSSARKRKQSDSLSSGERNGNSPNLRRVNLHVLRREGSGIYRLTDADS